MNNPLVLDDQVAVPRDGVDDLASPCDRRNDVAVFAYSDDDGPALNPPADVAPTIYAYDPSDGIDLMSDTAPENLSVFTYNDSDDPTCQAVPEENVTIYEYPL